MGTFAKRKALRFKTKPGSTWRLPHGAIRWAEYRPPEAVDDAGDDKEKMLVQGVTGAAVGELP